MSKEADLEAGGDKGDKEGDDGRQTFKEFVNESTFHGVKYIFDGGHVIRR